MVVTQPSAGQNPTVDSTSPRANEYMIFTVVSSAICLFFCNIPVFLCLCPAFIFATLVSPSIEHAIILNFLPWMQAVNQNNGGNYENAKSFGTASLICNILALFTAIVYLSVLVIVIVVLYIIVPE